MSTFIAPDGITWFEQVSDSKLVNCWSMCYANNLNAFFAVSYNGYARVLKSTDGTSWTSIVKGDAKGQLPKGWKHIVQGNVLVAVGVNGIILSTDGDHWTVPDLPQLNYNTVEYSPTLNRFVALTDNTAVLFSIDKNLTLTQQVVSIPTSKWSSLVYSPSLNRFVAVSYGTASALMYSTNGITWTTGNLPQNLWSKIVWSPERSQFLAIARSPTSNVASSSDGINWSTTNNSTNYWRDLAWSPELGMFMMVSSGFGNTNSSTGGGTSFTTYKTRRLSSVVWSSTHQMYVANVVQTQSLAPSDLYNVLIGKQITPSPTITPTVTPTMTVTPTPTITPTLTRTATVTPTITVTASVTPSITPTQTPSSTPGVTPTVTRTVTPTISITPTLTPAVTQSVTPSITPTKTPAVTQTATPSITPTISVTPSITPTLTVTPTITPSPSDTIAPMVNAIRTASQDWWSFNDNINNNKSGRGALIGQSTAYEVSPLGGKRLISSATHSGPLSEALNTSNFSIGAVVRVKPDSLNGVVFGTHSVSIPRACVSLVYDFEFNRLTWQINGSASNVIQITLPGIVAGQWFNTMLTVASNGDLNVYINGSLAVNGSMTFTALTNTNMELNDTRSGRICADIDELYTFTRALTASEINFLQGNGGKTWSPTFG